MSLEASDATYRKIRKLTKPGFPASRNRNRASITSVVETYLVMQ